jgi:nicotinate-nucleotide adenylyltransferase
MIDGDAAGRPRPRRLGVFGGTFDPPHIAHLVVAIDVRDALDLDEVLVVVAGEPWQKVDRREVSPAPLRFEMTRLALEGVDRLRACDLEVGRVGPSYTVDTLSELALLHPGAELHLILGADAAAGLHTWERAEGLADLCRIVVVDRPGTRASVPEGFEVERIDAPRLDLSSTELRDRVATGRSVRFLVPEAVRSFIEARELYGDRR